MLRVLSAALLAAAIGGPAAAQDAEIKALLEPDRRALLERDMVAELSRLREDRGLPPLEWDARLHLALREYAVDLLQAGWKGGPPVSTPGGKATMRAQRRHRHPAPEVFDNFSPQSAEKFSPEAVGEAVIGAELMASFRDPKNRLGAAFVVEGDGGIFTCIAVVAGDAAAARARDDQAAAAWLAVLGAKKGEQAAALRKHTPQGAAAAVPWLFDLLRTERDDALRTAVVQHLAMVESALVIEPLIGVLGKAKDDLRTATESALNGLTGQSYDSAAKWMEWWRGARPEFTLPPKAPAGPASPGEPVDPVAAAAGYRRAAKKQDPLLRAIAARGLGAAKPPRAAATLAKAAMDKDPWIARAGVAALGALGDPSALTKLQKPWGRMLARPRHALVAIRAAGACGNAKAAKLLGSGVGAGGSAAVDVARVQALCALRDPKALGIAVGALKPLHAAHGDGALAAANGALEAATGAKPGATPDGWAAWWKANKQGYAFPTAGAGE